jgi:hypothetical protein
VHRSWGFIHRQDDCRYFAYVSIAFSVLVV